MAMIPPSQVAAHYRRASFEMKFALEREVRLCMETAALTARSFIGHEVSGWDPLAASTVAEKQALGYVGQVSATDPLLRTGVLLESISSETESFLGGVEGIVGSTDPVAAIQELGDARIPPRPFLGPALMLAEPAIEAALGALAVRALTPGKRL